MPTAIAHATSSFGRLSSSCDGLAGAAVATW
jgi:hypothetical protein